MRKTNRELAEFYGIEEGDIVEVIFDDEEKDEYPFKVENLDEEYPLTYEYAPGKYGREKLSYIGMNEYRVIKPKKKYGETLCDDYDNCHECPLYLLRCDGYDGKDMNWTLYRILNEVCYKVGMKSDNPIYKAIRAELDKEVE